MQVPNIKGMNNIRLGEELEKVLGIKVALERDVHMLYFWDKYEQKIADTYSVTVDIDKVVLANVRIVTSGSNQNATDSLTLTLFKSGSKWYCMDAMEQVDYACQYDGYDLW